MSLLLPGGVFGATIGAFVGALFLSTLFARFFRRLLKFRHTLALFIGCSITPPFIFLYSWLATDEMMRALGGTGSVRAPRPGESGGPVHLLVGTLLPRIGNGQPILYFAAYLGVLALMLGPRYLRAKQLDAGIGTEGRADGD
jgi:hypothetical protein